VTENKEVDVIWPVGMRGADDRPFTFPQGATDDQKAGVFREVIGDHILAEEEGFEPPSELPR
jgi:hypothetical protein